MKSRRTFIKTLAVTPVALVTAARLGPKRPEQPDVRMEQSSFIAKSFTEEYQEILDKILSGKVQPAQWKPTHSA